MVVSAGAVGMPDSGSAAVQWTVTSPLYQPAAFGLGGRRAGQQRAPWCRRPERSTTRVAVLPALSVAVPVTVTPGWTVLELVVEPSARQVAMPEARARVGRR